MILAIDPGNTHSAYAFIGGENRKPIDVGKVPNLELRDSLRRDIWAVDVVAIEMVASYGMAVGAEVFDTCVWAGRFDEAFGGSGRCGLDSAELIYRREVKLHHCHSTAAKDGNVIQALVDRFAPGQPNRGKGTNAQPGWFHGFAADMWQAYALAVLVADRLDGYQP